MTAIQIKNGHKKLRPVKLDPSRWDGVSRSWAREDKMYEDKLHFFKSYSINFPKARGIYKRLKSFAYRYLVI